LAEYGVNSVCKILRGQVSVQLIVFFAAIRDFLKKEIYRADKPLFYALKTKGEFCVG